MMERNTTLGHRITTDKKNEFDAAFASLQSELLTSKGMKITKEDFLEALIGISGLVTWKDIKKIVGETA